VHVDPKKVEVMKHWPHLKTLKSLCDFHALVGYSRKFVHNHGKIAVPLTTLFEKNAFI
jgi:hypothetical protein